MFVREKRIRGYSDLYLVESVRDNGCRKQPIIKNLGRKEVVEANGDLDRLVRSMGRYARRAMVLSAMQRGDATGLWCRRIGPPLVCERRWAETGCKAVIESLLAERGFDFAVERAVFVTALRRLMVSGSDRACDKWMRDDRIAGAGELALHHFYRSMAWFGEELPEARPEADALAPCCVKDAIEEELFRHRHNLFVDLSVVFMDTTSLSFTGKGGMISADAIASLEERILDYILGVRERSDKLVREIELQDPGAFTPLAIPRQRRGDTELEAKAVTLGGHRYIVCRNLEEAAKDDANRDAILAGLKKQLKRGDKALIGNSAYRRFLKPADGRRFQIDPDRVAAEARFDGLYVLRTNTGLDPLQAVLRFRELLAVEDIFRIAKSLLTTRPIYHQSDAAIRGHVFCSFLAPVLRKALYDRCAQAGFQPEWQDVRLDLDRLQEAELHHDAKHLILRTPTTGVAGTLFQATGVALPPNVRYAAARI